MTSATINQLNHLYGEGSFEIFHRQCPSQDNTVHCGPIACANAMNLASGIDITNLQYDLNKIRTHTHKIISEKSFILYPLASMRAEADDQLNHQNCRS